MEQQIYSVKDIAKMANVSVATVSRVINQNGRFSKETEQRVLDIIKKCNYQPNQLARGLRTNRAQVVGVLVPDITNNYFSKITLEIQKNLLARDYLTIICNTSEDADIELRQLAMLKGQQVSGIIFICNMNLEQSFSVPSVFIDRRPPKTQINGDHIIIESDNFQGGQLAANELIDKGCRIIACISFGETVSSHKGRVDGYREALQQRGIEIRDDLIIYTSRAASEEGYIITKELLQRHPEIDGIFFTADVLAIGAIKAANELEYNIPSRLKLVGFDDIALSALISPALTTIHQNAEELGTLAVEKLMDMIENQFISERYCSIPVYIVNRQTT